MKSGKYKEYYWLVSSEALWSIEKLVVAYHEDRKLGITSFDSGPLKPTEEEKHLGWKFENEVMYSPRLKEGLEIPHDQYDEWYIDSDLELPTEGLEVFVNYGGFSLVPPEESYKEFDPSWEKGTLDFLKPIQIRFWAQIEKLDPETFVAVGDNDVVVSKSKNFIEAVVCEHNYEL